MIITIHTLGSLNLFGGHIFVQIKHCIKITIFGMIIFFIKYYRKQITLYAIQGNCC